MQETKLLRERIAGGGFDPEFSALYGGTSAASCRERWLSVLAGYEKAFGPADRTALFSAPGRSELGGNHTDHQRGKVLAASIHLDVIAAAVPNESGMIRILSEGFPADVVDLSETAPRPEEVGKSSALIRGIAAKFLSLGYPVTGFDAYTTSNVLKGSGLSSSAAFEVLVGTILNGLFAGNAVSPVEIAQIGQYAENVYFGKPCGLEDQMASSVGGIIAIDFEREGAPRIEQIAFDLASCGYVLCIIDSGADHADLTDECAAITRELAQVCGCFGRQALREIPEEEFFAALPSVRAAAGDRAVLRAIHVYEDNRRVEEMTAALRAGDLPRYLRLVGESGISSWTQLQNVSPTGSTVHQEVALALSLARRLLGGQGACRVHGGGFAGTLQAYVPAKQLDAFVSGIEAVFGPGSCHIMSIRPRGGIQLA